jgi:hypothetical protein
VLLCLGLLVRGAGVAVVVCLGEAW